MDFFHSFLPRVEKRIIYARVLRVLNLFLAAVSCLTNQYLFRIAMCQLIRDHLPSAISSSHSDTVFTRLIYSSILIGVFFYLFNWRVNNSIEIEYNGEFQQWTNPIKTAFPIFRFIPMYILSYKSYTAGIIWIL